MSIFITLRYPVEDFLATVLYTVLQPWSRRERGR